MAGADLGGVGRLRAAADRLRDETGYRWRFRFEQQAVAAALATAREALGQDADAATAQGRSLDLRDVATHQHVLGRVEVGEGLAGDLVDDMQDLDRVPGGNDVELVVERPEVIGALGAEPVGRSRRVPDALAVVALARCQALSNAG